jgi:plastocyanin
MIRGANLIKRATHIRAFEGLQKKPVGDGTMKKYYILVAFALVVATVMVAGCTSSSNPSPSAASASPITTAATTAAPTAGTPSPSATTSAAGPIASPSGQTVVISGFSFQPAALTVQTGASVTWRNDDSVAHRIVSDTNAFSSSNLNQGNTFTHQFNQAGSYPYHCGIHPYMTGTVTVQ